MLVIAAFWAGDAARGGSALAALRALGRPAADTIGPAPYLAVQSAQDHYWEPGMENYWKADYLADLDEDAVESIVRAAGSFSSPESDIHLVPLGGAVGRASENTTAFGHRNAKILFAAAARWSGSSGGDRHVAWARAVWDDLHRLAPGVYVNFLGDEGTGRVREAYGDRTYRRLVALKNRWDPANLFRVNQNIPPEPLGAAG